MRIRGEILCYKVHLFYLKGFSTERLQNTGIGLKGKGQLVGIEGLILPVILCLGLSVFSVSQQRMTGGGKLGTDLMGAAGDELTLNEAEITALFEGLVFGDAGLGTALSHRHDSFLHP